MYLSASRSRVQTTPGGGRAGGRGIGSKQSIEEVGFGGSGVVRVGLDRKNRFYVKILRLVFGELAGRGAGGNAESIPDVLDSARLTEDSGSIVFTVVKDFRGLG